ncbi:MAG TPA: HmuY family protein [Flavobacteriaceae bacterium]|nr:HmuY family protein [Flavobacteriaceae bacterium]
MKTLHLLSLLVLAVTFASCSSDDDSNQPQLEIEAETVTNLYAPQEGGQGQPISGDYTKFSFSTGTTTDSETEWDIAFRGTTILVNGGEATATDQPERTGIAGAYTATSTFADVTTVNTALLNQDSSSGGLAISTWYDYNPTTHIITPKAGNILVIKTHDGKYAKMEILSYYEDGTPNDSATNYQYYTFDYVYQPNEGETSFQ